MHMLIRDRVNSTDAYEYISRYELFQSTLAFWQSMQRIIIKV